MTMISTIYFFRHWLFSGRLFWILYVSIDYVNGYVVYTIYGCNNCC